MNSTMWPLPSIRAMPKAEAASRVTVVQAMVRRAFDAMCFSSMSFRSIL